jgi:hypothetical protein
MAQARNAQTVWPVSRVAFRSMLCAQTQFGVASASPAVAAGLCAHCGLLSLCGAAVRQMVAMCYGNLCQQLQERLYCCLLTE